MIESLPMALHEYDREYYPPDWDFRSSGLTFYIRLNCPYCDTPIEIAVAEYWNKAYEVVRYLCDGCFNCYRNLPAEAIWKANCQFIAQGI